MTVVIFILVYINMHSAHIYQVVIKKKEENIKIVIFIHALNTYIPGRNTKNRNLVLRKIKIKLC